VSAIQSSGSKVAGTRTSSDETLEEEDLGDCCQGRQRQQEEAERDPPPQRPEHRPELGEDLAQGHVGGVLDQTRVVRPWAK